MELQGTVVQWRSGIAKVQIAVSACSACTHNCSARLGDGGRYLLAEAPSPLLPGQSVLVDVALPSPARAVALAYVLPLAGFMAGLFIGNAAFGGAPLPALGLGLAEDPGGGLSFGQSRCRIAAEGLVRAHAEGAQSPAARAERMAAAFRERGLDPLCPYLEPGSRDTYTFEPDA